MVYQVEEPIEEDTTLILERYGLSSDVVLLLSVLHFFCYIFETAHRVDLFNFRYRNCPIDLKEAVSSVMFASPRCADVPELMDIRKHFTAKYGKEFVSAAVELRPDSGVSRMVCFYTLCNFFG